MLNLTPSLMILNSPPLYNGRIYRGGHVHPNPRSCDITLGYRPEVMGLTLDSIPLVPAQ